MLARIRAIVITLFGGLNGGHGGPRRGPRGGKPVVPRSFTRHDHDDSMARTSRDSQWVSEGEGGGAVLDS